MNSIIKPTSDIFFKYLLGSEEHKDLLLSFLNAVLVDSEFNPIAAVEIKNPFNIKKHQVDKESILDVNATDDIGRQYDVEMQALGESSFKNRTLYYWAKLYTAQLQEGQIYSKLKPAICINMLDFILFDEFDAIHTCFLPIEKDHPEYVLTDHLILHFLEIPKLKDYIVNNKLFKWLAFFKSEGQREDIVKILIKDDDDIARAHKAYKHFIQDEELRDLYESRQKWKHDYNTGIALAEEKGRKEGLKEGELHEKQNVLIMLISQKYGIDASEKSQIQVISDTNKLDTAIKSMLVSQSKQEILDYLK